MNRWLVSRHLLLAGATIALSFVLAWRLEDAAPWVVVVPVALGLAMGHNTLKEWRGTGGPPRTPEAPEVG